MAFGLGLNLAPLIKNVRDEIERTRRLPASLVLAMQEADIFRMWFPGRLGGPELSVTEFVQVAETLSYADGAVGWCAGLGAAYSRFGGLLPTTVAMRVSDGNAGRVTHDSFAIE